MQIPTEPPPLPDYLFEKEKPFKWTDEQERALDAIDNWVCGDGRFFSLTGAAGVGKSSLVKEITKRHPYADLTAMTGKAALRLAQCAGRGASTLHSKLYYPPKPGERKNGQLEFTKLRDPESNFVIIDEASMVTPTIFKDLGSWGPRVLLVGDPYQLPPVMTGKEAQSSGGDYSVFSDVRGATLNTVMRSVGGVLRAATWTRENNQICRKSDLEGGGGYLYVSERRPSDYAVTEYLRDRDDHILITWRNAIRMRANKTIRERLGHTGEVPDVGEPVLLRRNGGGFLNGEVVICGGFESGPKLGNILTLWMTVGEGPLRVLISFQGGNPDKGGEFFDGQMPFIESFYKYENDILNHQVYEPVPATWGYCLTAHAAQGSEARRVTTFLENGDDRSTHFNKPTTLPNGSIMPFSARWSYTAMSRGKKVSTMVVGR